MPIYTDYQTALVDAVHHQLFINAIERRTARGEILSEYDYEALANDLYFDNTVVPENLWLYSQEGSILFGERQRATFRANYRENLSDAYARTAGEEARERIGGGASDLDEAYLNGLI